MWLACFAVRVCRALNTTEVTTATTAMAVVTMLKTTELSIRSPYGDRHPSAVPTALPRGLVDHHDRRARLAERPQCRSVRLLHADAAGLNARGGRGRGGAVD